jgi:hypothetical protein
MKACRGYQRRTAFAGRLVNWAELNHHHWWQAHWMTPSDQMQWFPVVGQGEVKESPAERREAEGSRDLEAPQSVDHQQGHFQMGQTLHQ